VRRHEVDRELRGAARHGRPGRRGRVPERVGAARDDAGAPAASSLGISAWLATIASIATPASRSALAPSPVSRTGISSSRVTITAWTRRGLVSISLIRAACRLIGPTRTISVTPSGACRNGTMRPVGGASTTIRS
jgi:hypothetical protein